MRDELRDGWGLPFEGFLEPNKGSFEEGQKQAGGRAMGLRDPGRGFQETSRR
jgi:hypothetical protein